MASDTLMKFLSNLTIMYKQRHDMIIKQGFVSQGQIQLVYNFNSLTLLFTLKKGNTPETPVFIDNFDTCWFLFSEISILSFTTKCHASPTTFQSIYLTLLYALNDNELSTIFDFSNSHVTLKACSNALYTHYTTLDFV